MSKNCSILVCDCAIVLEMKVSSVQFSHFESFPTSFLGLLVVLCNGFSESIVFKAYLQILVTHAINLPTLFN